MTLKWTLLALVQYEIIVITSPSITGVTYMDDFDFEERYRDVNECNPLHWHPLHIPDYCANVFEKLIRSRLSINTPVRIKKKKEKKEKKIKQKDSIYSLDTTYTSYNYPEINYEFSNNDDIPAYDITSAEYESYSPPYTNPLPMSPYEEMLELLKKDIKKGASSPTVTVIPNIGPVALYDQAISKKSVNFIRQMAEASVKATKKSYDDYYAAYGTFPSEPRLYVYDSAKNKTKTEKAKKDEKKKDKDNKNKVYKVKTKHGDVVTIIETKNAEMMKNYPAGLMF